jgi:hypothetical protein
MNGKACSLIDAMKQGKEICRLFGTSDKELTKWHDEAKFKNTLTNNVTQTAKLSDAELSVTIRTSYDKELPWRVVCELGFTRTRK